MKKRFLSAFLCFCFLVLSCFVLGACDEQPQPEAPILQENFAMIGNTVYKNFAEAVSAVPFNGEQTTIKLVSNATGGGSKVNEGESLENYQNIVFDFNGFTYYMDQPTVGSAGTETNGFQLLQGGKVTFKNGRLQNKPRGAKIMLQNYCDLTLQDFTVDNSKSESFVDENNKNQVYGQYAVSNNFGSLTVKGNSNIIARENFVAFDLWFGLKDKYKTGVNVNIDPTFTGSVYGKIEYGCSNTRGVENWRELTNLEINAGNFYDFSLASSSTNALEGASISIKGGKFVLAENTTFDQSFVPSGCSARQDGNTWIVVKNA